MSSTEFPSTQPQDLSTTFAGDGRDFQRKPANKFGAQPEGLSWNLPGGSLVLGNLVPTKASSVSAARIDVDELYPDRTLVSPLLGVALGLLDKALLHIQVAREAIQQDEQIDSDDAMQRLHGLLPELFCCRAIGDGFGAIIDAVSNSIENLAGKPAAKDQILSIEQAITRIKQEPFIEFREASYQIDGLENVGLVVDPAGFEELADLLDE